MQMFKYVLKRLAYSIVTLFVLVALTFFLQHMLPGDPFIGDKALPDATMEALRAKYGLDKSLPEQFLIYLGNCLRGDLGLSIQNNRPVTTIIYESFLVSFDLGIRAIIFALILGVFLGTVAAIKRGKAIDTVCMFIALVGVSVPSFIMASLLQYFLGLQLTTALKGAGMSAMFAATGWEAPNSKILPVLALGFGSLAQISRLTRTSMLDVLGQDYIKTARAKGLSQGAIIWRHAPAQRHHARGHGAGPHHRRRAHWRLRGGEHLRRARPWQVLRAEHPGAGLHHDLRYHHFLWCVPDPGKPGGGSGVRHHRPQSQAGGGLNTWKKSTRAVLAGWAPTRNAGSPSPAPASPSGGTPWAGLPKTRWPWYVSSSSF